MVSKTTFKQRWSKSPPRGSQSYVSTTSRAAVSLILLSFSSFFLARRGRNLLLFERKPRAQKKRDIKKSSIRLFLIPEEAEELEED